jgi:hypothetical protein
VCVFQNFVLYGDVGVIRVCIVGANGYICIVSGENGVFQIFLSFSIMLYIMPVCVVSTDGLLLPCFLVVCTFRLSVVDSLVVLIFDVLYWYASVYWSFLYVAVSCFLLRCNFVAFADVVL